MTNTYGESALTKREEDVVSHLLKGKSNVQIAAGLNISLNTVKTHLKHVFSKMEVRSRQELIVQLLSEQIRRSSSHPNLGG